MSSSGKTKKIVTESNQEVIGPISKIGIKLQLPALDTKGDSSIFTFSLDPGVPVPYHIHLIQDEYVYMVEGEFECELDGKKFHASKGDAFYAPRGIPHGFANVGNTPALAFTVFTPGGIEDYFREVSKYAAQNNLTDENLAMLNKKYKQIFPYIPK